MEYDLGFLADTLVGPDKSDSDIIMGKIVSAQTGNTYTINLRGDTTAVAGVRSMVPLVANDVVWCLRKGSFILVINHQDTGWVAAGFGGAWVAYDAATFPVQYRKVNGIVYVQGLIKNGANGTAAFTLSAGYRPAKTLYIATTAADAFGEVTISSNGNITPQTGSTVWHSLANVSFPAEG